MKNIIFITTVLLTISSFGQILPGKAPGVTISNIDEIQNDTIIKVAYKDYIYTEVAENVSKPAIFINSILVDENRLKTMNPNDIENIKIEKGDVEIENVKYFGKIIIKTKSYYNPKLISLSKLKTKYINAKYNSVIFRIDNEIMYTNYDNFIVDEKFILSIKVESFENKEGLNVSFVNLITKSEENIKKAKNIIIR